MWVSEGRILETDRLLRIPCITRECARWHPCSTVLHMALMLVEAVGVRDRSFIMGVQ